MKKILIRIIVAVAVAVILSKLKLLNIIEVNALQVQNNNIRDFCIYPDYTATCSTSLTDYQFNGNSFRGYKYNTNGSLVNYQSMSTSVQVPQGFTNKLTDVQFSFVTSWTSTFSNNPIRVYIKDQLNDIGVCEVSSPSLVNVDGSSYTSSYWRMSTAYCKNVFIGNVDNVRIFFNGPFLDKSRDEYFAVSQVTFIFNNDLEDALRQQNQTSEDIKKNTKETNDLIKNEESVSNSDIESVLDSQDESNSPITDLVSMPLTLLNKINTGFSSSCSPFSLGTLYGESLVLPCINFSSRLGSLWSIIDIFFSIFMAYNIGMMCIRIYNNLTTLKDDSNSVYGGGN